MPNNYVIKSTAKASLSGKWPQAVSIAAIILSVFCLYIVLIELILTPFSAITNEYSVAFIIIAISVVFAQFFGMPLLYGALRWFWFTSSDADVPVSEIFCYFSSGKEYLRALSLSFRIFMRSTAVLFFCFLPSMIVIAISSPTTYDMLNAPMPYWASSVWAIGNALTFLGLVMSFLTLIRYFTAPILMINDPTLSPNEALDLSVIITKNANGKTSAFVLSFVGWAILSLLAIFPILFALPYFLASYSVFCRFLINHYNNKIASSYNLY